MTIITMRIQPQGRYQAPDAQRLKRLLKVLLRAYGFRCVTITAEGGEDNESMETGNQTSQGVCRGNSQEGV